MCCRLQRFFCCSLKTGTIIISIAKVFMIFGIIFLENTGYTSFLNIKNYVNIEETENCFRVEICFAVVYLLVSLLLLWGVQKKNNTFMLLWLVLEGIGFIFMLIIPIGPFIAIFLVPTSVVIEEYFYTSQVFLVCTGTNGYV